MRGNVLFLRADPLLQVVDIPWVVERRDLIAGGLSTLEHVHVLPEPIALDQAVSHLDPPGLHGVLLTKVEVCHGIIIDIGYFLHLVLVSRIL